MQSFIPIFEIVVLVINIFSILILSVGVVLCAVNLLSVAASKRSKSEKMTDLQHAKTELGGFVLLGLEVLIVADIIETVIRPTIDDILRLAAIVTIRTVISYFLNKEIQEIKTTEEET